VNANQVSLLEVSGLSKAFGGVHAVRDVSFSVRDGEVLGLVGPNGSGKTTVFNLIAGALPADRGEVYFSRRRITRCSPSTRAALGIGRTFQLVRTFPHLSLLENILAGRLYGREPVRSLPRARADAMMLLDRVGLAGKRDAPAAQLTLNDRKRLEIGRALATQPRLLLLDEPVAGLNPAEVNGLLALLGEIRAGGVTLVIVEHNVRLMRALCDRIVVLHSGKKIAEGTPAEALDHAEVVRVYLGRT